MRLFRGLGQEEVGWRVLAGRLHHTDGVEANTSTWLPSREMGECGRRVQSITAGQRASPNGSLPFH